MKTYVKRFYNSRPLNGQIGLKLDSTTSSIFIKSEESILTNLKFEKLIHFTRGGGGGDGLIFDSPLFLVVNNSGSSWSLKKRRKNEDKIKTLEYSNSVEKNKRWFSETS